MDGGNPRIPDASRLISPVVPIGTRDGTLLKDGYLKNLIVEVLEDGRKFVSKRPGLSSYVTFNGGGAGTTQGMWYHNGYMYAAATNTLSRITSPTSSAYTVGTAWSNLTVPTWRGRAKFASVVFNGQIFVIGGEVAIGTPISDVWSSADGGTTWVQLVAAAPWGVRSFQRAVVLNGRLYIMGGVDGAGNFYNDVWVTDDGVNWSLVTGSAGWTPRSSFACCVFNNGIWVMGGNGNNDVWFSTDGNAWVRMIAAAAWAGRGNMGCLVFAGKMWIIGGNAGGREVWWTVDGIVWTMTTNVAFNNSRDSFGCVVYNGLMWVLCGFSAGLGAYQTDIWSSPDGITWTQVTAAFGGSARGAIQSVVFKHPTSSVSAPTMYILGGTDLVPNYIKEVWVANINGNLSTNWTITGATTPYQKMQGTSVGNNTYFALKDTRGMYLLHANSILQVSDPNYPKATVPGVVNLDETLYVMDPTGLIVGCVPGDPTVWPSRNYIGADYESDGGVALLKYQNFVMALGNFTTQFFINSGVSSYTVLRPVKNMNSRVGCLYPYTAINLENTVAWVGRTEGNDKAQVFKMEGNSIKTISTPWVEKIINRWSTANSDSIIAENIKGRGRSFYVLTNTVENAFSLAYDFTNDFWDIWASPGSGFFLACAFTATDNVNSYAMDPVTRTIYTVDENTYVDAGTGPFTAQCTTGPIDNGLGALRKHCTALTIVMDREASGGSAVQLEHTKDDYVTWTNLGTKDANQQRLRWTRIGQYVKIAYRVTHAANAPFRMEILDPEIRVGN